MKTKCLLRNIETGEEIIGLRDEDQAYFSNGQVADFEFWEIVDQHPNIITLVLFAISFVGASFLWLIFWGDQ